MRIKVEIADNTHVFVHELDPQIKSLHTSGLDQLYVLCDQADFKAQNIPGSLSVFLTRQKLQALYDQLKEILEPESEASQCAQPVSV